jgi:hypothetical protein
VDAEAQAGRVERAPDAHLRLSIALSD